MKVLRPVVVFVVVFILAAGFWSQGFAASARSSAKRGSHTVWLVLFSSHDCPKCESVKDLIEVMKVKYPVRIKTFDVEKDKDYSLFKRLQAIHAPGGFSVPLIMVGDTILMGEDEITAKLDEAVAGLVKAGGAQLPYLGPARSSAEPKKPAKCNDCDSDRPARPPSASEEWKTLRSFLNNLF